MHGVDYPNKMCMDRDDTRINRVMGWEGSTSRTGGDTLLMWIITVYNKTRE